MYFRCTFFAMSNWNWINSIHFCCLSSDILILFTKCRTYESHDTVEDFRISSFIFIIKSKIMTVPNQKAGKKFVLQKHFSFRKETDSGWKQWCSTMNEGSEEALSDIITKLIEERSLSWQKPWLHSYFPFMSLVSNW